MSKKDLYLSASRIGTYEGCSQQYFAKYILKIPDKGNPGSSRGTASHLIFELLLNPRHKKHYDTIIKNGSVKSSKAVDRLITKLISKDVYLEEFDHKGINNRQLIDEMILVGLKADFFCAGWKLEQAETEIKIETPRYRVIGYIDKFATSGNKALISDYKSSQDYGDNSIQAITYALWAKRVRNMDSVAQFVYLRFPEDSIREYSFSEDELAGFEEYLAGLYQKLSNFTAEDADSNLAANKGYPKKGEPFGGKTMCGYAKFPGHTNKEGKPYYHCFAKFPRNYWGLKRNGEIFKTADTVDELGDGFKAGDELVELHYKGCPYFN